MYHATFIAKAKYCRGLTAGTFRDANGTFAPSIVRALLAEGLLEETPDGPRAAHLSTRVLGFATDFAVQRPRTTPILVTSAGDAELRDAFCREFSASDFELPATIRFDASAFDAYEVTSMVPFAQAKAFASNLLAPYFDGLLALAVLGFRNLYVLAIRPQPLDENAFARVNGFAVPARLRYKATMLFNAVLREFAERHPQVRFLDTWDRFTSNGTLDMAYHLDELHLNQRAAAVALDLLFDDLIARSQQADIAAYERARRLSVVSPIPDTVLADAFARDGVVGVELGSEVAQSVRGALTFAFDISRRFVPTGWAGDQLEPAPRTLMDAEPSERLLRALADALLGGRASDAIVSCTGGTYTVQNARAFRSLLNENVFAGPIPRQCVAGAAPPGVIRGVLYLTDAPPEERALRWLRDETGLAASGVTAGTLILYDGRAARGTEPLGWHHECIDIVVVPRPAGEPARVVCAGLNASWPLDPLRFDRNGLAVYET